MPQSIPGLILVLGKKSFFWSVFLIILLAIQALITPHIDRYSIMDVFIS